MKPLLLILLLFPIPRPKLDNVNYNNYKYERYGNTILIDKCEFATYGDNLFTDIECFEGVDINE